jgi:PAS domain S-box-containing protein
MNKLRKAKRELVEENHSLREAIRLQTDQAELAFMESNMIASAMDAILIIDESHNIVQFNIAAEEVFGYRASEAVGKSIHMLLPEQFRERHIQHIQDFGKTGSTSRNTRELRTRTGLRANGQVFPLEISIARFTKESRNFYMVIVRDVSERTKLEELLIRQYDSLSSLHQITLDLLSQRDIRQVLQFIVDEAAKRLAATYCEMLLPENEELVAKAYRRGSPFPSGNRFRRSDAPLSWKVFDSGVPAIVDDYSRWGPHNQIFEAHQFQAAAAIPILVGEKCIGVLGFARTEPGHRFTEEDVLPNI